MLRMHCLHLGATNACQEGNVALCHRNRMRGRLQGAKAGCSTALPGQRALRVLDQLAALYGIPQRIKWRTPCRAWTCLIWDRPMLTLAHVPHAAGERGMRSEALRFVFDAISAILVPVVDLIRLFHAQQPPSL